MCVSKGNGHKTFLQNYCSDHADYKDGIKIKGGKIGMPCTHCTVI